MFLVIWTSYSKYNLYFDKLMQNILDDILENLWQILVKK